MPGSPCVTHRSRRSTRLGTLEPPCAYALMASRRLVKSVEPGEPGRSRTRIDEGTRRMKWVAGLFALVILGCGCLLGLPGFTKFDPAAGTNTRPVTDRGVARVADCTSSG